MAVANRKAPNTKADTSGVVANETRQSAHI